MNCNVADLVAHRSAYTYDALVRMGGFGLPRLRQTAGFLVGHEFATNDSPSQTDVQALFRNSQSKNRERFFRNENRGVLLGYSTWADDSAAPTMVSNAKPMSDSILEGA